MKFEPGVATHVVAAPEEHDVGSVPLTDKVRSTPYVLLFVFLLLGVVCELWSACPAASSHCKLVAAA
jgi:hypothetical protein